MGDFDVMMTIRSKVQRGAFIEEMAGEKMKVDHSQSSPLLIAQTPMTNP
jgi:hypothetical protein